LTCLGSRFTAFNRFGPALELSRTLSSRVTNGEGLSVLLSTHSFGTSDEHISITHVKAVAVGT
jgi:hypothetical protein